MGFINSLEPRMRWLAFPGFFRGIAIIHFTLLIGLTIRPEVATNLIFDWEKIQAGEVWRLVSFLFLIFPSYVPLLGTVGAIVFAIFGLRIAFLVNDSLENAWGVFRTSLFFFAIIIGQLFANCVLGATGLPYQIAGGAYLELAAFFAFATLFPKHTFLLMLIIPVHVWILAAISGFLLLANSLSNPFLGFFVLFAFGPYLWWAFPLVIRNGRNQRKISKRRVEFQSKTKGGQATSFHKCKVCGATENTHPDLEFRVADNDEEICTDCLDK
ncbi:hypothetical protein [Roseibacillus persicicus]|uniref:Peptidase S54 rhomboid domain-containing protein n=1 Tax=Roseibacillus persicicus TaxID=454148 RepID=A0A918WPW5_9BACT|nr:hypothetical protein [Roseibacillus persicicus]MDQ8190202.1 hypothetical protein [Roseibacillus persicicus]GHC66094.1 hypothetical protein GCM10007100_37400 [Roseibacillus persicicus]